MGRGGPKNPQNYVNVVYGCPLENNQRRRHEDTSVVTNIVFFLLCLLILAIICAIIWFRFLKPKFGKVEH